MGKAVGDVERDGKRGFAETKLGKWNSNSCMEALVSLLKRASTRFVGDSML
jgi:hypothetical protein